MNVPGALGIITGINAEQNGNHFAPVRALGIGIEQANVELQMLDVVVGQRRASGRFVKKIRRGHDGSPDTSMATAIRFRVDFIEALNCRKLREKTSLRVVQSIFVGALPLGPFEKRDRIDVQHDGQLFQHIDRRGVLFPLKHADIVAIDLGTISKFLLRQALGVSQSTQISGDNLPQSHAERSPVPLIYCHLDV